MSNSIKSWMGITQVDQEWPLVCHLLAFSTYSTLYSIEVLNGVYRV